ncbi:FIG001590: Putative conserved exported protein precursor [Pseudoalteromonas luteoviolacea B = ATCC 29581]|nr:FIG001590: Putative conserved exported protein precursor [Pseudoalteromonas luteoviolacea B = ATCC 29581]
MIEFPEYQAAQMLLEKQDIFVAPSEVHGTISGLLACGLSIEEKEYLTLLSDVFNDGQAFSGELKALFAKLYSQVVDGFTDEEFHFELYLPSSDESLTDQANGLVSWVAGFMLGFGLKQKDYGKLSADVKEVIKDFTEISKLDTTFEGGEEDEEALHEIIEYVRVSSLLCFAEMGKEVAPSSTNKKKTLH